MTDKRDEALKLALEALEWINRVNAMEYEYKQKARESLNAIYDALAEQQSGIKQVIDLYDSPEQPAQDQGQSCPNCDALTKQVTALKTCLEVERGFREQERPAQQQEPVGVVGTDIGGAHLMYGTKYVGTTPDKKTAIFFKDVPVGSPLYTSPQPAQQQEPVAWMDGYRNIYSLEEKAAGCPEATIALVPMANHKKTSGSPINEIQCVCGAVWLGEEMVHLPDKRPPASKPWVGLTEFDIDQIPYSCSHADSRLISYAIEAKLREKNA